MRVLGQGAPGLAQLIDLSSKVQNMMFADHCPAPASVHGVVNQAMLNCAPAAAAGEGPFPDGTQKPGDHLRKVFYRMGFNDQEIVALSGEQRDVAAQPAGRTMTSACTAGRLPLIAFSV